MTILIADDEPYALQSLLTELRKAVGADAGILTASNGLQALEIAAHTPLDVAFLDIEMNGISGLELAGRLKELQSEINVILITAHEEYALEAWRLYVSGYLLKPADSSDIRTALSHLRIPMKEEQPPEKELLRVQCFGNFEVFYKDEAVHFARSKAKELFAYLVSRRGAAASSGEICSILWEDDYDIIRKKSFVRTYFASIRKALRPYGMEEAVQHNRDAYSVRTELLDCDYYRFLNMDPVAVNSYRSEFMHQYSWAERLVYGIEAQIYPSE